MKKSITIIGLMLLSLVAPLKAQENEKDSEKEPSLHRVEFGFRFMPTFSSFDMTTSSGGTVKGETTLGYGGGAFMGFNFSNHIGLNGEVIYNSLSKI